MKLRVYVCKSLGILVTSGSPVSHGVWKNPAVLGCVSIMTLHHTWFPWAHFSPPVNQLCARPPKWQPHLPFSCLQPKSLIPFLPAAKRGSEGNPYFLLPIQNISASFTFECLLSAYFLLLLECSFIFLSELSARFTTCLYILAMSIVLWNFNMLDSMI